MLTNYILALLHHITKRALSFILTKFYMPNLNGWSTALSNKNLFFGIPYYLCIMFIP